MINILQKCHLFTYLFLPVGCKPFIKPFQCHYSKKFSYVNLVHMVENVGQYGWKSMNAEWGPVTAVATFSARRFLWISNFNSCCCGDLQTVIGTSFCDVPSNCDVTSYVTSFSPKFDVYGDFYVLLKKSWRFTYTFDVCNNFCVKVTQLTTVTIWENFRF